MKNIVCILCLFFFCYNALCQENNELSVVFDTTVYDFGQIVKGANAECDFVFHNQGEIPAVITDVKASCGCTVPTWTREPVKPSGSGTVKVKYNTNTIGAFSKSINVSTSGNKQIITLTIKGEVIKKK